MGIWRRLAVAKISKWVAHVPLCSILCKCSAKESAVDGINFTKTSLFDAIKRTTVERISSWFSCCPYRASETALKKQLPSACIGVALLWWEVRNDSISLNPLVGS